MVETANPSASQFYDKDASLINVALSRAKEVFIAVLDQAAVCYAHKLQEKQLKKPSDFLFYHVVNKGERLNSNELIIIESPNKIDKLYQELNKGMALEIIATNGQLAQLDTSKSWDPVHAQSPNWTELSDKEVNIYQRVAVLWPDLKVLNIATDPDSEGELMAWHFINRLKNFLPESTDGKGYPTIKRMKIFSFDKKSIIKSYESRTVGLNIGIIKGGLFRLILDQLISRHYPNKLNLGEKNQFHAGIGRVQLAILDLAKKHLKEDECYYIKAVFPISQLTCLGEFILTDNDNNPISFSDPLLANKAVQKLNKIIEIKGTVSLTWEAVTQQHAEYPAINTAQILQLACSELNFSPLKVMDILQQLYEDPATDIKEPHNGEVTWQA